MENPEIYLGDGVYLTADGHHFRLSTGSHRPSDWQSIVYMDDAVAKKLYEYFHSIYGPETENGKKT